MSYEDRWGMKPPARGSKFLEDWRRDGSPNSARERTPLPNPPTQKKGKA